MIIVLADDITGAAEIAGCALSYGLSTSLLTDAGAAHLPYSEVVVVATDIRSMTAADARREVETFCDLFARLQQTLKDSQEVVLFKKTDSVLRGHIRLELETLMERLGYSRALLVAQNPSKERVIDHGVYYVKGQPLSDTPFAHDPEYPAFTSDVSRLLGGVAKSLPIDSQLPDAAPTIYVADATSEEEVAVQVGKADKKSLLGGGADCFCAFIEERGERANYRGERREERGERIAFVAVERGATKDLIGGLLAVCGSTQSGRLTDTPLMQRLEAKEACIPDDVFEGASTERWIEDVRETYRQSQAFILRIGEHEVKGVDYAVRLRQVMAEATAAMVAARQPAVLVIEGGATAFAVLSRMGWTTFSVECDFAPGVVGMRYGQTLVVLKPGSYPWGGLFE